ncbi:MraY family glycosyltransferase [Rhodocytophaga rosea]|uniref:MraY family glycosyltransferase n=1 Tax=Rhodocytophaga rosea TaxID=2704465 RepID=UPI001E353228|nr:MraY family glycosyltransferase [Rhodocytophaga rosea]
MSGIPVIFLSFLWAFLISVFAIPSIIQIAHTKKLLNEPNGRTIHAYLTPRLGGLAIFSGFMSALTIFGRLEHGVQHLLAGCIVLFFIGLKDDIISVSAFKKFFVQILATGIVVFMADIRITSFQGLMGIYELENGISYGFTFLAIIGITNATNLIDGLDGLAGTIIIIIAVSFGVYFYLYGGEQYSAYADVAVCLAGGILGFLRYNFHRAVIFMGDAGSLVCGFIISVMAIQFVEMRATDSSPSIAIGILFIPLLDTLRVTIIRLYRGISPFTPDKNHIHHCLMSLGFAQLSTVAALGFFNVLIVLFVIFSQQWGVNLQLFILLFVSVLFSFVLGYLVKFKRLKTE